MFNPTVLVVEDDSVILRLIEVTFELEGFEVICAHDGPEGVEAARTQQPDLVITDLTMPGMSGPEVVAALKAEDATQDIPIILLSAKAQASDVQAGKDMGADDYLTKPFDPLELLDRVNELLEGGNRNY